MLEPTWPAPQTMTFMNWFLGSAALLRGGSAFQLGRTLDGAESEQAKLAVQRRPLHADEGRGARDIAAEPGDLRVEIASLEQLAGVAQRQRHHFGDAVAALRRLGDGADVGR